jgi:hypothetical protein
MKHLPPFLEFLEQVVRSAELMISENKLLLLLLAVLAGVRMAAPMLDFAPLALRLIPQLINFCGIIIQLALVRWFLINVAAVDEKSISNFRNLIIPYILTSLLYGLFMVLGTIVFVIPGIILFFSFLVYDFVIIASRRQYLDALTTSRMLMDGYKSQAFVYALAFSIPYIIFEILYRHGIGNVNTQMSQAGLITLAALLSPIWTVLMISFRGNVFLHVRPLQISE